MRLPGPVRAAGPVVAAALATALALGGTAMMAQRASDPGPGRVDEGPQEVDVVAYAVVDTPAGARLAAERRTVRASTSSLRAALLETLGGVPRRGGLTPVWPGAQGLEAEITVAGDLVELDLRGPDGDADGLDASGVSPLVGQAIAWTVAAATGDEYVVVDVTVDGGPASQLLPGLDGPVRPSVGGRVLAPVTVEDVREGQDLPSGSTVSGRAVTPAGGAVLWQLRRGGEVVRAGAAVPLRCCEAAPYEVELDAPPGDNVLSLAVGAFTESRSVRVSPAAS